MADTLHDAAMLVLIRDAIGTGTTPEVLLVKRCSHETPVPDAYTFPGGTLAPIDAIPSALSLSRVFTAAEAAFRLPDVESASRALSFWVAALRYTFEQVGILLARYGDGRLWEPEAHDLRRLMQHRKALQQGDTNFPNMMHDLERALATDLLVYFAHGIMPDTPSGHWSTRFFLAALPSGVSALPDQHAGGESLWVSPEEALQRSGKKTLAIPTVITHILQRLGPLPSAAQTLEHLRRQPVEMVSS